jgi:DUF1680 family protein
MIDRQTPMIQVEARTLAIENTPVKSLTVPASLLTAEGDIKANNLTMIPYYAWNNRGIGSMQVWFAATADKLRKQR